LKRILLDQPYQVITSVSPPENFRDASAIGLRIVPECLHLLRLLIIESAELGSRPAVCAQQFVELGLHCLHVSMLGTLNDNVMKRVATVAISCQCRVARPKISQSATYTSTATKA
jgi:hypothetical protein